MRPILRPNARVRLRSPAEVGAASWVEGTSAVAVFEVFLAALERGATATAVGALVGWPAAFSSGPLASLEAESRSSGGVERATVVSLGLLFDLLATLVLVFALGVVVALGRSAGAKSSSSSTVTLCADVLDDACCEETVAAG